MFWQEQTTPREGPSNHEKKVKTRPKLKKRNPERQLKKRLPVPKVKSISGKNLVSS
jgi:hypothetical protein